jgi:hypothetical protein
LPSVLIEPALLTAFLRPVQSGLGLGLFIARRTVEGGGASVTVRDVPGTGCVFTISLPRHSL